MERLSTPTLMVQENRLEESGGLDNFWTGRDRLAEWNRSFYLPRSSGCGRYYYPSSRLHRKHIISHIDHLVPAAVCV
jgi:hypothetical protein